MRPSEEQVRAKVREILLRLQAADGPASEERGARVIGVSDIEDLPPNSTLRVAKNAVITPLARDRARELGVRIERGDAPAAAQPTGPAERAVAIAADHGGYALKEQLKPYLRELGYEPVDLGTHSAESVDYPDFAYAAALMVSQGHCHAAIIIDGAGIGSCMAANKVPGVRASMCYDVSTAGNAREHNHANVLTLGAGLIGPNAAKQIVKTWLSTPWAGGRHARRVQKIMDIERRFSRMQGS